MKFFSTSSQRLVVSQATSDHWTQLIVPMKWQMGRDGLELIRDSANGLEITTATGSRK